MKLSFCLELLLDSGMSLDQACEFLAKLGYSGVEFAAYALTKDNPVTTESIRDLRKHAPEYRRILQKHGLAPAAFHWTYFKTAPGAFLITSSDRSMRERAAEYLTQMLGLTEDTGATILVLGSPHQRKLLNGMLKQEGRKWAAETIGLALDKHRGRVRIALEPLHKECADGENFLENAGEAMELIAHLGRGDVQLMLDTKAMKGETDPIPDVIRRCKGRLIHYHVNGYNRLGTGCHERGLPYFAPGLRTLQEIDYQGWISCEPFLQGGEYPPITDQAERNIAYVNACLSGQLPEFEEALV